jgi:hypothetical protein
LGAIFVHNFIRGFFAAALLCGCAAQATSEWTKGGMVGGTPGLSGELEIDIFTCERWSPGGGGKINAEGFRACMIALGWEPIGDGASAPDRLVQQ